METLSPARAGPPPDCGALAHPTLARVGSLPACLAAPPAWWRVGPMAGCPHPQASHPWFPAQALSCRPHPPHLLRPPPPHPDTRLSYVGPSQRAGAVDMGQSASLLMDRVSCVRPVATPNTRRNSATSSTSRAAAPTAHAATSSTTPAKTRLPLATPMCCARASASQAYPPAAEPHHHQRA